MQDNPYAKKTERLRRAVLDGPARLPMAVRRAAAENAGLPEPMANFVAQVHQDPLRVSDAQFDALRKTMDEERIFELTVAAASGAGFARLDRVLRLLDAVEEK